MLFKKKWHVFGLINASKSHHIYSVYVGIYNKVSKPKLTEQKNKDH